MREKFPHWLTVLLLSSIGFLISFGIVKIDTALADISTRVARIEGKLGITP